MIAKYIFKFFALNNYKKVWKENLQELFLEESASILKMLLLSILALGLFVCAIYEAISFLGLYLSGAPIINYHHLINSLLLLAPVVMIVHVIRSYIKELQAKISGLQDIFNHRFAIFSPIIDELKAEQQRFLANEIHNANKE